jgi:hypothetical protein
MKRLFYRVGDNNLSQGLWYDVNGNFTGLIHNEYDFCLNSDLAMEYDSELVGYLSVTDKLEDIFLWFTKEDLVKLSKFSYGIHVYESIDYKWYDRFKHWAIHQKTSNLIKIIEIETVL